jgi:hypothetical protein
MIVVIPEEKSIQNMYKSSETKKNRSMKRMKELSTARMCF